MLLTLVPQKQAGVLPARCSSVAATPKGRGLFFPTGATSSDNAEGL